MEIRPQQGGILRSLCQHETRRQTLQILYAVSERKISKNFNFEGTQRVIFGCKDLSAPPPKLFANLQGCGGGVWGGWKERKGRRKMCPACSFISFLFPLSPPPYPSPRPAKKICFFLPWEEREREIPHFFIRARKEISVCKKKIVRTHYSFRVSRGVSSWTNMFLKKCPKRDAFPRKFQPTLHFANTFYVV